MRVTHIPVQKKHILLRAADARVCVEIPQGFLRPAPAFGPKPGHFLEASCPGPGCCSLRWLPPVIPEFVRLSCPSLMVPPAGTGVPLQQWLGVCVPRLDQPSSWREATGNKFHLHTHFDK